MRIFRCLLFLALAYVGGLEANAAPAKPFADAEHLRVQLVMPQHVLVAGMPADAGLYFKLEPGWHVYWKNAGDAGEPPRVRWTLPEAITAGELQFPAPQRLPLGPLMDFGYENEVLFPLTLSVGKAARPGAAELQAKVDWLVCREKCIVGKAELALPVTVSTSRLKDVPAPDPDAAIFERLLKRLPEPLPAYARVSFSPTATGFKLYIDSGRAEASAQFFPSDSGILDNPAPQILSALQGGALLDLKKDANLTANPARLNGILELSGGRAYEISANPGMLPSSPPVPRLRWLDAARAAGLAFLGGLLLNLMPCVFPVLFLKGLSLVHASHQQQKELRGHGLVYTAGILASFWLLVGVLLGLRAAGSHLGWGFQFQSPIFLALMAGLLFFLGLSLAGQFEIGLTLTSAGGSLAAKQGYTGSFFTGVLAVVVATPCTAPLMGAAIGYALAQTAAVTFAVFTALGLGLAAPYLALTLHPAWTRILPRPGAWMEILKQATAVPIFATVIWLAWVLAGAYGANALAALLASFLLLAIAAWTLGRWPAHRLPSILAGIVILGAVALSVYAGRELLPARPELAGNRPKPSGFVMLSATDAQGNRLDPSGQLVWEPWSQAAVDKYRAAGRPVFVDFTASWCLSCQVNERVALNQPTVQMAFSKANVALLKADWTQRNEAITQALTSLGRSGVPDYVLYPPTTGEPTLLPETLTPGIVIDAVRQLPAASSPPATASK